ncbi:MAG: amidohydrolase [Cellulosilyticum sp.]|nr:amidohydrolase [Cellulosilyticum sp.]
MKIDMHVHITPEEISRDALKIGEKEPYFDLLSRTPKNQFATAEEIVAEMKKVGMDKSVVFGFSFQDMGLCQYVNDYVIEKVKAYPSELIGFMTVVPNHPDAPYEIERCYQAGLKGIGELFPAGQPFEISNHKDTAAFAECCKAYNLPVIVHMNEPVGHDYAGKTETSFKEIEAFVSHHPDLKIILAHFGGGIFMYEMMKEIRGLFKNVYYDHAASIFLYDESIYRVMREIGLLDKLLFGSDFPLLSPARYEASIEASGLNKEEKMKFYGDNAVRLLQECGISLGES